MKVINSLLILIKGFKQKGIRLQKQDYNTLIGLIIITIIFFVYS